MAESEGADEAEDSTRVSSAGITVTKTLNEERSSVPVFIFEFASDRSDTTTVRLVESIPEDVGLDALGFHPDFGEEHWHIDAGDAVFERDVDPGETYKTFYGVDAPSLDDPERMLSDPELVIDPPEPIDEASRSGTDTDDESDPDAATGASSDADSETASDDAAGAAGEADAGSSAGSEVVQEVLSASPDSVDIETGGADADEERDTAATDDSEGAAADDDAPSDTGDGTGFQWGDGTAAVSAGASDDDDSDLAAAAEDAIEAATDHIEQAHEEALELATNHIQQAREEAIEMARERIEEAIEDHEDD